MSKIAISSVLLFLIFGASSVHAQVVDTDGDGLSDEMETSVYFTNGNNPDTDGDGFLDGEEIANGYSPRHGENKKLRSVDSDNDGLWDDWELALGTSLMNPDTDGDGYRDGDEVRNSYDPLSTSSRKVAKRIEVSLGEQKLSYFFGDMKLDEFLISSGLPRTPTPTGEFRVLQKRPVVHYKGRNYDYPNTKWNLAFKRGRGYNYYIHGAWWHDDFGRRKSAGCVNVPYTYDYMGRLYDWAEVGTRVIIDN